MQIRSLLAAVAMCLLASSARAGDYTFDIPQLLGHYLGDIPAMPTVEVEVDLDMEFARIDGASLRLTGTHTPGLVGDLNSPHTFPLPVEIIASFDGPDLFSDVFIDERLPGESGAFDFNEPFRVGRFATGPTDFSPWLDGTAEFQFWVTPPPTLAIYYLIDMPSVTITSATLVIEGQPRFDALMLPGDFNGDGKIDGHDLLAWQRNPYVGLLSDWQAGYGTVTLSGVDDDPARTVAVPEPNCLVLALGAVLACCRRSRQTLDRAV